MVLGKVQSNFLSLQPVRKSRFILAIVRFLLHFPSNEKKRKMSAKKLTQEDLRKLMKEKRENLKSQKVDSPFAKYNSSDQLICTICNTVIKSNNLWVAHIGGKTHKENLHKVKKGSAENPPGNAVAVGIKRTIEQPNVQKKIKTHEFKVPQVPKATKPTAAASLLASYSSSDDDSEDEEDKNATETASSALPPNFFDNSPTNGVPPDPSKVSEDEKKTQVTSNKVETLPEGFFDDPILDAKARKVEYVDPQEEEWEKFKKSIAEETNVSKSIIEEDLQESTTEREIFLLDEEIHNWQRKNNLEVLAEDVKTKAAIKEEPKNESDSSDEDLDEDDLLDWRTKSIKKK